jgi:hypothetical protein
MDVKVLALDGKAKTEPALVASRGCNLLSLDALFGTDPDDKVLISV